MGQFLIFNDLSPLAPELTEEDAEVYIEDVEALAVNEAPCIESLTFVSGAVVKAILRQAVLRWHRAGEGGVTTHQQNAGPYGEMLVRDTRMSGAGRLLDTEIRRLKDLCRKHSGIGSGRKAFTVGPR